MQEERYRCNSDDYVVVKRGGVIAVRNGVAYDQSGDQMSIEVPVLRSSPDFTLESDDALPGQPSRPLVVVGAQFAVALKINRLFPTLEDARSAAEAEVSGEAYVVKVVGKVRVVKNVTFQSYEENRQ